MKCHSTDHPDTGFVDAEIPIWRRMHCLSYHYTNRPTIDKSSKGVLCSSTPPLSYSQSSIIRPLLHPRSISIQYQSKMKLTIFFPLAAFLSLTVADGLDDASPCLVCCPYRGVWCGLRRLTTFSLFWTDSLSQRSLCCSRLYLLYWFQVHLPKQSVQGYAR